MTTIELHQQTANAAWFKNFPLLVGVLSPYFSIHVFAYSLDHLTKSERWLNPQYSHSCSPRIIIRIIKSLM